MGKLDANELEKMLQCIQKDNRVLVPPTIGYDAGVHRLGDQYVAVATDPCTGVPEEWFGWLLINYAASDLALFGVKPEFCTVNLLGPRPTKPSRFQKAMTQICSAAQELNVAIVRGHTGMYDSLNDLLGVCTIYGTTTQEDLITPGGTKPGDLILATKPLGLETIINYSLTQIEQSKKLFGAQKQAEYGKLVPMQSCVKEALALCEACEVHAMHDATEGGFVAALNELAEASKVGIRVDWNKIEIPSEALTLQQHFGLTNWQLLSMSSTGTILGAVPPSAKEQVTASLKKQGLTAHFIGEYTENKKRILTKGNVTEAFPSHADDPYTAMMFNA